MKARINKDVRPYGGKLCDVLEQKTYPNGRKVVVLNVGNKKLTIAHRGPDCREYNEHEVEIINEAETLKSHTVYDGNVRMTRTITEISGNRGYIRYLGRKMPVDRNSYGHWQVGSPTQK